MVVRRLRVAIARVLHEASHREPQLRARVPGDGVFDRLTEVQGPGLRWLRLAQRVAVQQHGLPLVAVEVVHGAAGAHDQVVLAAEGPQRRADADVEVWVVAGVHGHDGHGWTVGVVGEHVDQDQEHVVDPVEVRVGADVEALCGEHVDAALCRGHVWVGLPVLVQGAGHEWRPVFFGRGVRRDFDFVAETVPVCTLEV